MEKIEYTICSNCIMDTTDEQIFFDERGILIITGVNFKG